MLLYFKFVEISDLWQHDKCQIMTENTNKATKQATTTSIKLIYLDSIHFNNVVKLDCSFKTDWKFVGIS